MKQSVELIDALNKTFGAHKSYRASHAKGFTVRGHFLPALEQSGLQIPLLEGKQPVVARFSVGGGKPGISDKSPTVRGFGLEIGTGTEAWVMALISNPVFFANSAEQFKAFLAARAPDPATGAPDPAKVQAFNAANPNTIPHQAYLKSVAPCRCYSAEAYHSGHAYQFQVDGEPLFARVQLEPEGGRIGLSDEEMQNLSDDFLYDRMVRVLMDGSAVWSLKLLVATEGDEVGDPTVPWLEEKTELLLGRIQINLPDDRAESLRRVFDPAHMPQGVGAPLDQVFDLRSMAYAESYRRRSL